MKKTAAVLLLLSLPLLLFAARRSELHIVTTGDVHGSFFNRPYVDGARTRTSLMSVKHYVDSLRAAVGPDNVLLLDAGDILQGDNASYYYNYVATGEPHIYPRLAKYMGYDACTLGNHDIETGHAVYDRVLAQMTELGVPWLGGNAIKPDGSLYFPEYVVVNKAGRRILVMGYNNANIDHWLSQEQWSGMSHVSLIPYVQRRVDALRASVKPDAVVVLVHSGTGQGDGSILENQGLDLFHSLHGVDVLVCAHDHQPATFSKEGLVMVDGGARCSNVGHVVLSFRCRKVASRKAEVVRMDKNIVDEAMVAAFDPEFQAVREFTIREVGTLGVTLRSREAYAGMCPYIDLLQTVQLAASGADVSLAAPLSFNSTVPSGPIVFDDMFKIYPFENQLYVLLLTGAEIKGLLEYSYGNWITAPGEHLLAIRQRADDRTGASRWSFINRSYNFDSAAGIIYTVDVTKPEGNRVCIESFADGRPFEPEATYRVAMTSYRANGGGDLLTDGAGIPHDGLAARVENKYPEIRNLVYDFFREHGTVDSGILSDRSVLGSWRFVPESVASPLLASDLKLLF